MAAICLSPVLGLRCLGLSHIQEAVSLVPIGLEVVFSLGLIFAGRDAGRIRYFLAAEGPVYLLLAVLSLLGHVIPFFQNKLVPFEVLDIVIGVTSLVPVLLYTTFLYLFNQREFFPRLPKRFMRVVEAFSLVVIPIIVMTNEIGSFIGIKYRRDPDVNKPSMSYQLSGGSGAQEFARELLNSTSLALLVVAQALTFLLFFVALVLGFLRQRCIEDHAATEREGVLFRGLGWLTVGIKLCMFETIFGWVTPNFDLVLLRRVLRMIGRACIIIGVVKGPERREEFIILDNESGRNFLSGTRKLTVTGLRLQISSPTLLETSMSHRLSRMTFLRPPFARSDNSEQIPSTSQRMSIVPLDPSTHTTTQGTKARPPPLMLGGSSEDSHVTVIHTLGRAPTLVLKLPSTQLPSGNAIAAMSEKLLSAPASAMAPPLSRAATISAPLTAPLPRAHRPPENYPGTSRSDRVRRSSDFSAFLRRPVKGPMASTVEMQSRALSRSAPSSPQVPHTLQPLTSAIPRVPQRAPASEDRAPTTRPSMRTRPDRRATEGSPASGISTEWITSDNDSIKAIGAVQPHMTPNPTRDVAVRASVVLERLGEMVEPPQLPPTPESGANLVRKDSGVLGKDDLVRIRRAKSVY